MTLGASASNYTDLTPRTATGTGTTNPLYRLVLMDATGRYGIRRTLRQVLNGNQMSWQDAGPPVTNEPDLPSGFIPARCRIEVRDNRYTWMLTVRKRPLDSSLTSWKGEVDMVAFFNRSFKASDETTISTYATFQMPKQDQKFWGGFDGAAGVAGVDDDLDGFTDWSDPPTNSTYDLKELGWPGSDDRRTLAFDTSANGPLPVGIKKGAYLLEPTQARWYRIVNINTKSTPNNLILLDHDLIDVPTSNPINFVLMKGIVQVFELGTFSGTQ